MAAAADAVVVGKPIGKQVAVELLNVVFGMPSSALLRSTWFRSALTFRPPDSPLSFGLVTQTNEAKGLLMCVQSYVLKHALLAGLLTGGGRGNLTRCDQEALLSRAVADVLWKAAGGGDTVTVCLPSQEVCIDDDNDFAADGLTERIHTYEFGQRDDLQAFLRRNLHVLQEASEAGCLLLVYSAALTRGVRRLRKELEAEHLLTHRGECTQALVNMLLTGSATPHTHNGTALYDDDDDEGRTVIKLGIVERSEIGFLTWQRSDPNGSLIGSRLKTPCLPIWVTKTGSQYGVLYSGNRELTRDYHAERRFDIYYYSSNRSQSDVTCLSIDTKSVRNKEDRDVPLLERLVLTK